MDEEMVNGLLSFPTHDAQIQNIVRHETSPPKVIAFESFAATAGQLKASALGGTKPNYTRALWVIGWGGPSKAR